MSVTMGSVTGYGRVNVRETALHVMCVAGGTEVTEPLIAGAAHNELLHQPIGDDARVGHRLAQPSNVWLDDVARSCHDPGGVVAVAVEIGAHDDVAERPCLSVDLCDPPPQTKLGRSAESAWNLATS